MDKAKLVELADRCETATGPDRRLDVAIAKAVGRYGSVVIGSASTYFTASLDAAMTLVPDGMSWVIGIDITGTHFANVDFAARREGATPAIALCAAALRARAEQAE